MPRFRVWVGLGLLASAGCRCEGGEVVFLAANPSPSPVALQCGGGCLPESVAPTSGYFNFQLSSCRTGGLTLDISPSFSRAALRTFRLTAGNDLFEPVLLTVSGRSYNTATILMRSKEAALLALNQELTTTTTKAADAPFNVTIDYSFTFVQEKNSGTTGCELGCNGKGTSIIEVDPKLTLANAPTGHLVVDGDPGDFAYRVTVQGLRRIAASPFNDNDKDGLLDTATYVNDEYSWLGEGFDGSDIDLLNGHRFDPANPSIREFLNDLPAPTSEPPPLTGNNYRSFETSGACGLRVRMTEWQYPYSRSDGQNDPGFYRVGFDEKILAAPLTATFDTSIAPTSVAGNTYTFAVAPSNNVVLNNFNIQGGLTDTCPSTRDDYGVVATGASGNLATGFEFQLTNASRTETLTISDKGGNQLVFTLVFNVANADTGGGGGSGGGGGAPLNPWIGPGCQSDMTNGANVTVTGGPFSSENYGSLSNFRRVPEGTELLLEANISPGFDLEVFEFACWVGDCVDLETVPPTASLRVTRDGTFLDPVCAAVFRNTADRSAGGPPPASCIQERCIR